jgi:hypothetical protein
MAQQSSRKAAPKAKKGMRDLKSMGAKTAAQVKGGQKASAERIRIK